jgi:hypothetical protein
MANGRGWLECCYCEHYRCHNPVWVGYDAAYEAGECLHHRTRLPDTLEEPVLAHRVCSDFQPNEWYSRDSIATADERFSYFSLPLVPGVLYGYHYSYPPNVKQIAVLAPNSRKPDKQV